MIAKRSSSGGASGRFFRPAGLVIPAALTLLVLHCQGSFGQAPAAPAGAVQKHGGGEAALVLPDLSKVDFHGINARTLLEMGLGVCVLGLLFGLVIYEDLKRL